MNPRAFFILCLIVVACGGTEVSPIDGGIDDASIDRGRDVTPDAPRDVAVDAPVDASVDAPIDTGDPDTGIDAGFDASKDSGLDAIADAGNCKDNNDCNSVTLFCKKQNGDCSGVGTCTVRPTICPLVLDPACGCNKVTYGNPCQANAAGQNVAYKGTCE